MDFDPDRSGLMAVRLEAERESVRPLTEAILSDSQRYVPVLSGELLASGHTEYADGGTTGLVVYGDGLPDKRAIYQELGTSRMDAQPYLRPAAYQAREL